MQFAATNRSMVECVLPGSASLDDFCETGRKEDPHRPRPKLEAPWAFGRWYGVMRDGLSYGMVRYRTIHYNSASLHNCTIKWAFPSEREA